MESLPFQRTIATGFYDGPIEGFTECSECKQAYSFRKLDWDDLQNVRITGFTPLQISLDTIATRLKINRLTALPVSLVPPLSDPIETFVKELLAYHPNYVAAVSGGWPGQSSVWRDIRGLDLQSISDWFSFLGISKGTSPDELSE
jgi:hypothetical protein